MLRFWIVILIIGLHHYTSAKQCSSPGKFPQDQADNCGGYALCLMSGPGTYAQYNLTCPPGFIYNHVYYQCTNETSYNCVPDFNCSEVGRFPNPFSDNCTTYITCVEGLNDIMTARSVECSLNQIFNPLENSCVNSNETSYKCPSKQSPDVTEESVLLLESTINGAEYLTSEVVFVVLISVLNFHMLS